MSRTILRVKKANWGLSGPGSWKDRTWEIKDDGTWILMVRYILVIPDGYEKGSFSPEDFERLCELINAPWSEEKTDACDGVAWEFKAYGPELRLIKHRELSYIYGIETYESIAAILNRYDQCPNKREVREKP